MLVAMAVAMTTDRNDVAMRYYGWWVWMETWLWNNDGRAMESEDDGGGRFRRRIGWVVFRYPIRVRPSW